MTLPPRRSKRRLARHTWGVRAFVAVWPPEAVVRALRALDRPNHPDVRWVTEDRWHVTLAFVGDLDPARLAALAAALDDAVRRCGPPAAVLGPRTERSGPGVLWVPVDGLDPLAAAARRAARAAGCPVADEPFLGHLTLARARGRRRLPSGLAGAQVSASWTVDEVRLVTSVLEATGARYEVVGAARLVPG